MASKKNHQDSHTKFKPIHSLSSPFPDPEWPHIDRKHQDTILELFCQLLEPLGRHQKIVPKSKGKRRKRERSETYEPEKEELESELKFRPEIGGHLTIGFKSTYRLLEDLVSTQRNSLSSSGFHESVASSNDSRDSVIDESPAQDSSATQMKQKSSKLAAVLVDRSSQPSVMIQHIPIMIATAARSLEAGSSLWLVALPNGSGDRLREAVGVPRIGLFGLMKEAPGSKILLDYIETHVPPVKALTFSSLIPTSFMPLNIETKFVEVPVSKSTRKEADSTIKGNSVVSDAGKETSGVVNKSAAKKQRR